MISLENLPPDTFPLNGVTTVFNTSFAFIYSSHLVVTYIPDTGSNETLVEGTHYSVTGGDGDSGVVTTEGANSPYDDGTLHVDRVTPITQSLDVQRSPNFSPDDLERALDSGILVVADRIVATQRAMIFPSTTPGSFDYEFPNAPIAGRGLAINAAGDGVEQVASFSGLSVSAFMETMLDAADYGEALDDLAVTAWAQTLLLAANAAAGRAIMGADLPTGYRSTNQPISHAADTEHDITIAAGKWRDSTDTIDIVLPTSLTKQIDAAATVGDDAGGFPSGLTLTVDQPYGVFVTINSTTGEVDGGYDEDPAAADLLSDYGHDCYRLVEWVHTDGSENIRNGIWMGGWFVLDVPPSDVDVSNQSTTYVARTLTAPPSCMVFGMLSVDHATYGFVKIRPGGTSYGSPSVDSSPLRNIRMGTSGNNGFAPWMSAVDSNRQIETAGESASTTVRITTEGWYFPIP